MLCASADWIVPYIFIIAAHRIIIFFFSKPIHHILMNVNNVSLSNIESCAPALLGTNAVKRAQWTEAVPQLRIYNHKHYYQEKQIDLTLTRNH